MKRLFIILVSVILCSISHAENIPHRNGLRFTEYSFPLKGDVEQIEIIGFSINTENGEEYPRDTTLIKFNKNGDVNYICPYVDLNKDVVYPKELYLLYNDLGYNTRIREIGYVIAGLTIEYETLFTYNDSWQKIKGERYSDDGHIIHTEEYVYDSHGCLTTKKYISGNECAVYTYDNHMNVVEIEEYYDDKGFLFSKEMKTPTPEMFRKLFKDSSTETTDSWTYKCDSYGNVVEKISYHTDTSCPNYRTEYRISYR